MKKLLSSKSADKDQQDKEILFPNPEKFQISNFEQKHIQTNFQVIFLFPSNHFFISAVYAPQQRWQIAQPFAKMSCQY